MAEDYYYRVSLPIVLDDVLIQRFWEKVRRMPDEAAKLQCKRTKFITTESLRLLEAGLTQTDVAATLGISQGTVSKIKMRHVGKRQRKVSDEQVLDIFRRVKRGEPPDKLAAEYGISTNTVKGIRGRRNFRCLKPVSEEARHV